MPIDLNNKHTLSIKVIPNSSREILTLENGIFKLYIKAVPEKGKANEAVISFFKKHYKLDVSIKHGKISRNKVLQIRS